MQEIGGGNSHYHYANGLPEDLIPLREIGGWKILISASENKIYLQMSDYQSGHLALDKGDLRGILNAMKSSS